MRYWMHFYSIEAEIASVSDTTFMGRHLVISELKERFNKDFIKNPKCSLLRMNFVGNGVNASLIAGFRDTNVIVVDTNSKVEYSIKEFNQHLNSLEQLLTSDILISTPLGDGT